MTYVFSPKIPGSHDWCALPLRCLRTNSWPQATAIKCQVGCPIRKSLDQSPFPAPQSLSQGITSFIASCCQGIHQTPFSRLIRSRERKAGLLWPRPQACPHPCRPPPDQKSYISPPHPTPEGARGAAVSVLDLEQSHPRRARPLQAPHPRTPHTRDAQDGFDVLSSRCHVLIGRENATQALAGRMTAHQLPSRPNPHGPNPRARPARAKADGGSRRTRTSDLTLIRRAL